MSKYPVDKNNDNNVANKQQNKSKDNEVNMEQWNEDADDVEDDREDKAVSPPEDDDDMEGDPRLFPELSLFLSISCTSLCISS